jgi:biopolymer transport protein ExbD
MKIRQRPTKRARIEIIPMIDVIFFLLVFFMVSSLAMTKINSLPVALPKTSSSPEALKQNIILTVKKNGVIYINKAQTTLESLGSQLVFEMRNRPQDIVIINADEGASYGLVVQAMDQARKIGVRKFALATEAEGVRGKK